MYRHTETKNRPRKALPAPPVPDWSRLSRGDSVRVVRSNGTTASGSIDMLAPDRSIFWIIQEGGLGRVMICSADHPQVLVVCTAKTST